jgi:RNA-directed DNA polymerase
MLEKAKEVSNQMDGYEHLEYVRWADDLVILIDGSRKWKWLEQAIHIRLREELSKIKVKLNEEKTKIVDIKEGEIFSFLGFDFRRVKTKQGKNGIQKTPRMQARTNLLKKIKE